MSARGQQFPQQNMAERKHLNGNQNKTKLAPFGLAVEECVLIDTPVTFSNDSGPVSSIQRTRMSALALCQEENTAQHTNAK
jgi:hypothetical protein